MNALNISVLYADLMNLIADPKSGFRSRKYPLPNGNFAEVIDYTLSSFQYFKKPGGMLGRGIMFEVSPDGEVVRILSRPMKKFFSYQECPDTMKLDMDVSKIRRITDKADGSLMSTWMYDGELRVKSKGSIQSAEVRGTMALLESELPAPLKQSNAAMRQILGLAPVMDFDYLAYTYRDLAATLKTITEQGYTVDLEYLSKDVPVVIQYAEDELRVLSINDNASEQEFTPEAILHAGLISYDDYFVLKAFQAYSYYDETGQASPARDKLQAMGFDAFLQAISDINGIEGVIIELYDGQSASRVKFKTKKYLTHTKALTSLSYDSRFPERVYILREPFAVFAAIVEGYADDLVHAVRDCAPLANVVRKMQADLTPVYNEMFNQLTTFVEEHRHVEKRDFAAAAKEAFPAPLASAAMQYLVHNRLDLLGVLAKNKNLLPDLSVYAINQKDYPDELRHE